MTNNVDIIVIMYKDRLVRFGFELIEFICKFHCVDIEIIEVNEKSEQEGLVDDLIQIITVLVQDLVKNVKEEQRRLYLNYGVMKNDCI